jgi:hypothetical protein
MLLLTDVFAKTRRLGWPPPATEFWPEVLVGYGSASRELFVAEAYWDLVGAAAAGLTTATTSASATAGRRGRGPVRCLRADVGYQRRLVRFPENHDEPRAATTLAPVDGRAAAVVIATLPGATLWHGQFDGRRVRLLVFLGCRRSAARRRAASAPP